MGLHCFSKMTSWMIQLSVYVHVGIKFHQRRYDLQEWSSLFHQPTAYTINIVELVCTVIIHNLHCFCFQKSILHAYISHNAAADMPTFLFDGTATEFTIVAEGETICTVKNVLDAYSILFAVHYVFNLAYPKKVKNTFMFLQKVVLNITDNTSKSTKMIRVLYEVNSLLSKTNWYAYHKLVL